MGTNINVEIYVDAYLTEDGVGIYISPGGDEFKEVFIPYEKLVRDFIEMYQVPSDPPTMHDKDRVKVTELCNAILSALDLLRKLEHDTGTWKEKNRLGHRD